MDALSEMLRIIRVDSAIYFNAEFSEPWCVASPRMSALASIFEQPSAHLIVYHLLSEGNAYVELESGERIALCAGDLLSFPHGHPHRLGSGEAAVTVDAEKTLPGLVKNGLELFTLGGGGPATRFICGFLACDAQLSQSFLGGLPPFIRINLREDRDGQWLENSLRFSVNQAALRSADGSAMLSKLSEALFGETLRRYVRKLPAEQTGWFAGARDANVGRALTLIHHQPARSWSLADLAHEAGVSRTVLAERFRHFLGEPPMSYLTRWRLQLGARALTATPHGVARIALDVGYDSEAAFNRAFKREYGLPPARYRKDHADRRRHPPPA